MPSVFFIFAMVSSGIECCFFLNYGIVTDLKRQLKVVFKGSLMHKHSWTGLQVVVLCASAYR